MIIRSLLVIIAFDLGVFASAAVRADSRCPAGSTGCTMDNAVQNIQDRYNEAAGKIIRNENPYGRAQEAQDAMKYCVNCGMDAIKDGMDTVSGRRTRQ
ncbi:hypothetical protein [Methylococcus mesophilus]|uniref:hypothetical protein n=1 Tax=Methylococcus mesophilus TaxID=2993564 RepID=UPI00224A74BE|nr:hypothetical protein [Methylococcus mesophilus]UZR30417.1 hypothetical protein OOT43_07225 [Methylococcus mesophilus]